MRDKNTSTPNGGESKALTAASGGSVALYAPGLTLWSALIRPENYDYDPRLNYDVILGRLTDEQIAAANWIAGQRETASDDEVVPECAVGRAVRTAEEKFLRGLDTPEARSRMALIRRRRWRA
jgi:hypothetical protein